MAEARDLADDRLHRVYDDGFIVRRMKHTDTPVVINWYSTICATSTDLEIALEEYSDSIVAVVGELDGKVVASAVRTPVAEKIFYGSLFYVDAALRMKGYGRRVRDDVADFYLEDSVLCIDAHEELLEMNKRQGYTEAFEVVHYKGVVIKSELRCNLADTTVVPFENEFLRELLGYDDKCFVCPGSEYRSKLLKRWTSIPGGKSVLAVKDAGDESVRKMVGHGCRRPATVAGNHIIGPLYADSEQIACNIVASLIEDIIGQVIWMSIWIPNIGSSSLVTKLQLLPCIHMYRMYKNGSLPPLSEQVFALTSIDICGF